MQRISVGLLTGLLAGGCVHNANLDQVHAGMTHEQVVAVMGQPESTTSTPGRECTTYSVLKDFWSRVPWDMTNRYYVCYVDGKVDYFGRADQPDNVKSSLR
ncbi:MAG TPA: outer membrane protein assembly factor BamE [Reyranella sp.]|nr:outer membrane protein assembly factor BamE [Reyranella sp.]